MATMNPFDLLGDDDNEDPSQLIAAHQQKLASPKKSQAPVQPAAQPAKPAKLPSKPLPPAQAGELRFPLLLFIFYFLFLVLNDSYSISICYCNVFSGFRLLSSILKSFHCVHTYGFICVCLYIFCVMYILLPEVGF
jgi:hypothetical protein